MDIIVRFDVTAATEYGDELYVAGNVFPLGNWNVIFVYH